jgi:hypothetical protein
MAVSKQWAMIRSWLRKTHNKEVYEFFKDLPNDLDPDNSSGRSTTKAVCLIGAGDSQGIAEIKMRNFEALKKKVGLDYVPVHDFELLPDTTVQGKPQIQLWFQEKLSHAKAHNRRQKWARVSLRLDEKWHSDTSSHSMALKIKNKFANPIFSLEKGKYTYTYKDSMINQRFLVNVSNESEARRIIENALDLINENPKWNLLRRGNYVEEPVRETERILGETVSVSSPIVETTLYFKYAIAKIWPLPQDIPLVDTTGTYYNAVYHEDNPFLNEPRQPVTSKASPLPLR